jgi:hypothetical protein
MHVIPQMTRYTKDFSPMMREPSNSGFGAQMVRRNGQEPTYRFLLHTLKVAGGYQKDRRHSSPVLEVAQYQVEPVIQRKQPLPINVLRFAFQCLSRSFV